jgi:hypothetical protein
MFASQNNRNEKTEEFSLAAWNDGQQRGDKDGFKSGSYPGMNPTLV